VQIRLVGLAGALVATALASGCNLAGPSPSQPSEKSGQVSIDGHTRNSETVACSQVEWFQTIELNVPPGRAEASLELSGAEPVVRTVNITNIDDITGSVGGDVGTAKAVIDRGTYTITGTAIGTDRANPGQSRELPFEIKVPC
jgi:ipoprotein LpqH